MRRRADPGGLWLSLDLVTILRPVAVVGATHGSKYAPSGLLLRLVAKSHTAITLIVPLLSGTVMSWPRTPFLCARAPYDI